MKKTFVFGILVVVILSLAFSVQAQNEEKVTLVIWGDPGGNCINDPANDWSFCAFARMVDERWSELHPNIELVWEDHGWDEALRQEFIKASEAGNEPDIMIGESFMPGLTQAGYFLALNSSDEFKADLIPSTVQAVTFEDEIYGVAVFTGIFTLEVNNDVFLALGYNIDDVDLSSWDAVLDLATRITEDSGGRYYGTTILGPTPFPAAALFRVAPYIYQTGADFCEMPACEVPTLDDPKGIPAYQWFRDLYKNADSEITFSGDESFVFSQLFAGNAALQTAGSWHIAWAKTSGCVDCRYFPLPLPEDGERANVVVGNAIYAALASTEYPEETIMFLEFIGSPEIQNAVFWTGGVGRLPTTYSAVDTILETINTGDTSNIPSFYTEVLNYDLDNAPAEAKLYEPFLDELVEGNPRILPPWKPELSALWNEMFAEILQSDEPIEDILAKYQAQALEIAD